MLAEAGAAGGTPSGLCNTPAVPDAPLRRLSHFEYNNTVRALGDSSEPANRFEPEVSGQTQIGTAQLEQYRFAARDFARRVTASDGALQELTGCEPEAAAEAPCWQTFVADFLGRAFRRPPTADEQAEFVAVFTQGVELGGGVSSGVRAVVEVALQSPEFLYRVEFGEPLDDAAGADRAGWARPTPYEMASRLSYLLWGAPPDSALLEAAADGTLRDKDVIASEARRMLEDERARALVRHFYFEQLGISQRLPSVSLEPNTAALAVTETEHFIDAVTWEEPGTFASLLTAPFTFLNEPLANYYGIDGVSGEDFTRVELSTTYGAGILTQASFVVAMSVPERTSPTRRGLSLMARLLCRPAPLPPSGLTPVFPLPEPGLSTRELLIASTREASCAECHDRVDPLGFAFEHYDWTGRYRETEGSYPIDATGSIELDGAQVQFDGPRELAAALAASDEAHQCYVQNWLRFALGRPPAEADACSRQQLEVSFQAAKQNVPELLVALTQTDAFLYRPALPEQP